MAAAALRSPGTMPSPSSRPLRPLRAASSTPRSQDRRGQARSRACRSSSALRPKYKVLFASLPLLSVISGVSSALLSYGALPSGLEEVAAAAGWQSLHLGTTLAAVAKLSPTPKTLPLTRCYDSIQPCSSYDVGARDVLKTAIAVRSPVAGRVSPLPPSQVSVFPQRSVSGSSSAFLYR